jgi:hypothetical protein
MDFLRETLRDLETGMKLVPAAVNGLVDEQWRQRPANGGWSVLEVVHHLWDEEREDFPLRLRRVLADPGQDWPPIDPQGWPLSRAYNTADPEAVLQGFLAERRHNLEWLAGLESPDWSRARIHPVAGPLSARQLALSWRAHDLLHTRQLLRLRYALLKARCESPHDLDYAGSW